MSKTVRVRRLNDAEGRQLQQIVRRGGKSDRSIVKWRRAMVVLASAGGNDVATIARLVQTSPDRVREMIHRFNDVGMRSLDPRWAGGRPRLITTTDRALIVKTARTRPTKLRRPFSHWSVRKLADYLAAKRGRKVQVGRERLRQILNAEGITFQRTKTWKESPDPLKEQKLSRIEWVGTCQEQDVRVRRVRPVDDQTSRRCLVGAAPQAGPVAGELPQAARLTTVVRLLLDRR